MELAPLQARCQPQLLDNPGLCGFNATFRVFPTLQDSPSLSREGIPEGLKEHEFGDWAQTFWM